MAYLLLTLLRNRKARIRIHLKEILLLKPVLKFKINTCDIRVLIGS